MHNMNVFYRGPLLWKHSDDKLSNAGTYECRILHNVIQTISVMGVERQKKEIRMVYGEIKASISLSYVSLTTYYQQQSIDINQCVLTDHYVDPVLLPDTGVAIAACKST